MNINRLLLIAPLPLLLLLVLSCQSVGARQELLAVESYLNSDPERALAVLDSMDRQELTTREDRAHYALLKSMALDKNYIDLTSDSVIAPAVAYYSKHGTADQKMKAYFYQGVVYFNGRYLSQALLSFYQAQECMESSEDARLKGIIYMALSDLYELLYDSPMVKKYLDKGIEQFVIAKDTTQYRIALLQKAVYCQSVNEVAVADSLYSELLEEIETLPSYSAQMLLTNYAKLCMINPVPKAQEAIQLYEKLFNEYGYRLRESHAGPLAYAYELVGDSCTANYIFQRFENDENHPLAYWKYLSEKHRGNLDKALIELEHVNQTQSHLFQRKMSIGEDRLLIQYLEEMNVAEKQEKFILVLLLLLLLMFVTFIAFYINANLKLRNRKANQKLQSMLLAANEVNELMRTQLDSVRKEDIASHLQKEFFRKYKAQLAILADLYTAYYASGDFYDRRATVYGYVDKLVQNMRDSDRLTTAIIQQIKHNTPYGEAIDSLKLNTKEQEIFCYYFMGLKPQLISVLMDIDLQNVYKIRSRMKRKIGLLDQGARDFLLTHF